MNKYEQAVRFHGTGSNCAQSVLCVFADELGFDLAQAHRLAAGLGAGLGRRQHLCGAVNGGAMALGAALGGVSGADQEAKERSYAAVRAFLNAVEEEFGTLGCAELLEVNLLTEEGKALYKERDLGKQVCERIIGRCAELVEERLAGEHP